MKRVRTATAVIALFGLGAAPAFLLGDAVASDLPTVSVSVDVPTDAVPTVSVPDLPVPDIEPDPSDPTQPVEDAVSGVSDGAGSAVGGGGGGSGLVGGDGSGLPSTGGGGSGALGGVVSDSGLGGSANGGGSKAGRDGRGARGGHHAGRSPRVTSFETRPSRFKTRGDDHRGTKLRYRLTRAGLVRFTVFRLAPSCERVGSFLRKGRRGLNEAWFAGRVNGRPLSPGTYKIVARPLGRARGATESDRFVVVAPSDSVASAEAQPSVCGSGADWGAGSGASGRSDAAALRADPGGSLDPADGGAIPTSVDADPADAGDGAGGVAQFRESSPGVLGGGNDEVPLALVLAFCIAVGSLVPFLAYVGARDLRRRLRGQ
jgi:hypothetical protein